MNIKMLHTKKTRKTTSGSSRFAHPLCVMHPPVTKYVSLHSRSLCKDMARASCACKNMNTQSCGANVQLKDNPCQNLGPYRMVR